MSCSRIGLFHATGLCIPPSRCEHEDCSACTAQQRVLSQALASGLDPGRSKPSLGDHLWMPPAVHNTYSLLGCCKLSHGSSNTVLLKQVKVQPASAAVCDHPTSPFGRGRTGSPMSHHVRAAGPAHTCVWLSVPYTHRHPCVRLVQMHRNRALLRRR